MNIEYIEEFLKKEVHQENANTIFNEGMAISKEILLLAQESTGDSRHELETQARKVIEHSLHGNSRELVRPFVNRIISDYL